MINATFLKAQLMYGSYHKERERERERERDKCAKNDNSLGKVESLNLMARRTEVTSLTDKQPQPGYNNLRL